MARRKSKEDEIKLLKKQVRELKREVKELKEIVMTYMTEPKKAILEFFGYGGEEILTPEGLGVEYVKIVRKIIEKKIKEEGGGEAEEAS